MTNIIVIAGPTATGKTDLSVSLAKAFNGEIVNADSMQIYRGMDIGTAKPGLDEQAGVPHHLMDFLDPLDSFSVKEYVDLAHPLIRSLQERGKLPIIVGGTGLYINSLVDCTVFSDQETAPDVTARLNKILETDGAEALHAELLEIDPALAEQLHPNNTRRVFRALELYYATGVTPTQLRKEAVSQPSVYRPLMLAADFDRSVLYERINLRVQRMLDSGLVDEVKRLRDHGCTAAHQSMQGIGYRETFDYLDGRISLETLCEQICQNTRRYAKRQLTWFRRDSRILWHQGGFDTDAALSQVSEFLTNGR